MSQRPAWRYAAWNHWNYLALAWFLLGMTTAVFANLIISRWWYLATNRHTGAVAMAAGSAVFLADVVCRMRDRYSTGVSRFLSFEAGGSVACIPAWVIAIFFMGTAFALLLGLA